MALIAAAILTCGTPTPGDVIHGKATYMNPGRMQEVIANRELGWSTGIALNREGDLFRWVYLEWPDGTIDGPLISVDCAQAAYYETRERQGRVVEVSAELARERGFFGIGPEPVTVWLIKPPEMRWE